MNRRRFLTLFGLGALAPVAAAKGLAQVGVEAALERPRQEPENIPPAFTWGCTCITAFGDSCIYEVQGAKCPGAIAPQNVQYTYHRARGTCAGPRSKS